MVEPLLSGIVLGMITNGLFVAAFLQYRREISSKSNFVKMQIKICKILIKLNLTIF
jgi:hypothetical protein